MVRLTTCCFALGLLAPTASADPPKLGDSFPLTGADKQQWLYDAPAANDAAGKVVIHWFCTVKIGTCVDDLARIVTLRDAGRTYIVAYINGSQRDAKKLDPIRESEGVGRGTVAYGPNVTKLFKTLGFASGEASIVVDVDGKVKAVTTSGDINELDARDATVKSLIDQVKDYTSSFDGPATAKPGDKFVLSVKIQLAGWLNYSAKTPTDFQISLPKDIRCEKATKIEGHTLIASATCSGPKGHYEAQGRVKFGYDAPGGGTGLGGDGTTWKFEIK